MLTRQMGDHQGAKPIKASANEEGFKDLARRTVGKTNRQEANNENSGPSPLSKPTGRQAGHEIVQSTSPVLTHNQQKR
jgi:hypothetical protein